MANVTDATSPDRMTGPTPDNAIRDAERLDDGPMLAADGTPLKRSLQRALRREKIRALLLIAPLLIFVLVTFIAPIADMLFRSVENQIVGDTLPRTVEALEDWDSDSGELPGEQVYRAMFFDLFLAAEAKQHTRLGTRLNYERTGMSSLFRSTGRDMDDMAEPSVDAFEEMDERWEEAPVWLQMMQGAGPADEALLSQQQARVASLTRDPVSTDIGFVPGQDIAELLPRTAREYTAFALYAVNFDGEDLAEEEPWEAVYAALALDLQEGAAGRVADYTGPGAELLQAAAANVEALPQIDFREAFLEIDEDWGEIGNWATMQTYSAPYTPGYFLNAVDLQLTDDGVERRDEDQRIYAMLFQRTLFMSLVITISCILLGYPVAWLLANLPMRSANLLMILVLLPFWTSLLVRTSAWKVLLQQQGVINDTLVWIGLISDDGRLVMINNQLGTIIAMTHILLPFMILPLYSVMKTIPPSYLRAAKSLGANNWTAFWRVYFPNSVPGIGAGSVLVFILSIGYYITPELVGGTTGLHLEPDRLSHLQLAQLGAGGGAGVDPAAGGADPVLGL